jgi:hypothetical protein
MGVFGILPRFDPALRGGALRLAGDTEQSLVNAGRAGAWTPARQPVRRPALPRLPGSAI